jgi:hypothetical protein
MLKPTAERAEQARREAKDIFARERAKESEVVKEREKTFAARTEKTERLRALRLAREAQERAAVAAAPPVVKKTATKKKAKAGAAE